MFEFFFRSRPPSRNTVQAFIDSVQIRRDEIKKEHGLTESYWAGQYDILNQLIKDLTDLHNTLP